MKVFISWSGVRSTAVAQTLHDWLPQVMNAVEPWMSSEDMRKGSLWRLTLAEELESTHVGVICLTPENLRAPWLLFEAGALSKRVFKKLAVAQEARLPSGHGTPKTLSNGPY
jgi:TIR domain